MHATRTRTNRTVTATHWNGTTWSNGAPTVIKDVYIDSDYSTLNGNFSCRDLIITGTAILTITADTYVKVLRDIIQDAATKIIMKDKGSLMLLNKNAVTQTAKIRVEKTFPDMQRLDYEFMSSPISGIPIKNISPGTLNNRFYTYDEATASYSTLDPYISMTDAGIGYQIRTPSNFSSTVANFNIIIEKVNNEEINTGINKVLISRSFSGYLITGNPFLSLLNNKTFYNINKDIIENRSFVWKKTNGAQGLTYNNINIYTGNLFNTKGFFQVFQGFMIQKKSASPPNEIVFTPEMMLLTDDFTPPDRLYINIKQNNIFHPIGGFCYDVQKFPLPFQDIISGGAISIIDNVYKIICRKQSFNAATDVINVRVFFEIASNYTITLREVCGLFEELPNIYLIDEYLQGIHDLKISDYSFSSEAGEYLNRFKIKFTI